MLSVEGQRGFPSRVARFERLNVVGSSPERRASPDAVSPFRAASRSIACQMSAWLSIEPALCRWLFRCDVNSRVGESRALVPGRGRG